VRLSLALASALTDARCNNEKARSLSAWLRQAIRAVVSLLDKATGESADNTLTGHGFNESGLADASKLASSLSLRRPARSIGADNEHFTV
jgi:hypothetical protein